MWPKDALAKAAGRCVILSRIVPNRPRRVTADVGRPPAKGPVRQPHPTRPQRARTNGRPGVSGHPPEAAYKLSLGRYPPRVTPLEIEDKWVSGGESLNRQRPAVESSHTLVNTPGKPSIAIGTARRESRAVPIPSLLPVYQAGHNSYATYLFCGMREMGGFGG